MRAALLLVLTLAACGAPLEVPCINMVSANISCELGCVTFCTVDDAGLLVSLSSADCKPICWDNSRPRDAGVSP